MVAVGGFSFRVTLSLVEELGLSASSIMPGAELDEASVALVSLAAEAQEAERRGLTLLARAEQSAFMLRRKLEARGFSSRATILAISRLSAQKLLDDRRFASAYAASRLSRRGSKSEGPTSLLAALSKQGIDRDTAAEALADLLGPEGRRDALRKAGEKEMRRSLGDREAVKARLRALGYKSTEISEYLGDEADSN